MTDLLPDKLPSIEQLAAEPFGREVDKGGRQPKEGKRRHFSDLDKDRVFMVHLRTGRDIHRTCEITGVRPETLKKWCNSIHADRLHELSVRYGRELEEANVADMRSLVSLYSENEREALIRLRVEMPDLSPSELARVVKDLSMARSKLVHTYMTLEGRPTQVTEQRTVDDVEARLRRLGILEGEDVVEAEVVTDGDDTRPNWMVCDACGVREGALLSDEQRNCAHRWRRVFVTSVVEVEAEEVGDEGSD